MSWNQFEFIQDHVSFDDTDTQSKVKKLPRFTNFPAKIFLFGVRKNICTAPFPDGQELLS